MSKSSVDKFNKPGLFSPSFTRAIIEDGGGLKDASYNDISKTNIASTSSFRYDPPGSGIRSTQQISVDYSRFENHTFFGSARVNVNSAFDRIINGFPFDGSRKRREAFEDSLSGFDRYVLRQFPKNHGYLFFSGATGPTSEGTSISVKDFAGHLFPQLSRNRSGQSIIDPGLKSFTAEMHAFVPAEVNDNQVICQKLSPDGTSGISLVLSQSTSTTSASLIFGATSGAAYLRASGSITKNRFNQICAVFNRRPGVNKLELYVNQSLLATSSLAVEFGEIDFKTSPFTVGSGSIHYLVNLPENAAPDITTFTPKQTFSGAIDELRVFHDIRTTKQQSDFARKGIFPSDAGTLRLYFKLNEPTGSYASNDIALDSSGNSLHSRITNFNEALRVTSSVQNPMSFERLAENPVLFPLFHRTLNLNTKLLLTASLYDDINPNLITRLIPSHYFIEGQANDGLVNEEGTIVESFVGTNMPGTGQLGTAQALSSFLFMWAKQLDELKMVIDAFGQTFYLDYDTNDNVPDQFLPFLAQHYGIHLPNLFVNSSFDQFFDGDNLTTDISAETTSLQQVQNEIWRRILINIQDLIRSKGTLHSVKAIIRASGINPDSNFRIREYGGPTKQSLEVSRNGKTEVSTMLDFSGSRSPVTPTLNAQGIPSNKPFLLGSFMSGSRLEVGYPPPQGAMVTAHRYPVHGISNEANDGLFTSGSFTYEAIYRFPRLLSGSYSITQSLVRLATTGSLIADQQHGVVANLVSVSGSNTVSLFVTPIASASYQQNNLLTVTVPANIFDGKAWNVSFGRYRNDDPRLPMTGAATTSIISASYFLRCARQNFGKILEAHTASVFYSTPASTDVFQVTRTGSANPFNASGPFWLVGSQSLPAASNYYFLNNTQFNRAVRSTDFAGRIGHMRFWSKALLMREWREHVRNYKSIGVIDPLVNFNFETQPTGAFQRLRVDSTTDQLLSAANSSGDQQLFDFSQNGFTSTLSGFQPLATIMKPETFNFSYISPRFDEASTNEKVRVRGFLNSGRLDGRPWASVAPTYEIPLNERPNDDTRFSIEFSVIDALNEDIISMFATLDAMDNALGDPNLVFSPDYHRLEDMRKVYFNRLTDKMNVKGFFEFFKWFDTTIGTMIEQVIPRKTKYLGTNFVVESHMLERAKFEYQFSDMYIGEGNRSNMKGIIRLQQFVAMLRRY